MTGVTVPIREYSADSRRIRGGFAADSRQPRSYSRAGDVLPNVESSGRSAILPSASRGITGIVSGTFSGMAPMAIPSLRSWPAQ